MHWNYHNTMKNWGRLEWWKRGIDEAYQGLWFLGACADKAIMYKGVNIIRPP